MKSQKELLHRIGLLSNKFMPIWAAVAVSVMLLSVNVVPLQEFLKTTFLPLTSWILILAIAFVTTFWLETKN
jgi:hypothetical protein